MSEEQPEWNPERQPAPFWKSCLYALLALVLVIGFLFGTCLLLVN